MEHLLGLAAKHGIPNMRDNVPLKQRQVARHEQSGRRQHAERRTMSPTRWIERPGRSRRGRRRVRLLTSWHGEKTFLVLVCVLYSLTLYFRQRACLAPFCLWSLQCTPHSPSGARHTECGVYFDKCKTRTWFASLLCLPRCVLGGRDRPRCDIRPRMSRCEVSPEPRERSAISVFGISMAAHKPKVVSG